MTLLWYVGPSDSRAAEGSFLNVPGKLYFDVG